MDKDWIDIKDLPIGHYVIGRNAQKHEIRIVRLSSGVICSVRTFEQCDDCQVWRYFSEEDKERLRSSGVLYG